MNVAFQSLRAIGTAKATHSVQMPSKTHFSKMRLPIKCLAYMGVHTNIYVQIGKSRQQPGKWSLTPTEAFRATLLRGWRMITWVFYIDTGQTSKYFCALSHFISTKLHEQLCRPFDRWEAETHRSEVNLPRKAQLRVSPEARSQVWGLNLPVWMPCCDDTVCLLTHLVGAVVNWYQYPVAGWELEFLIARLKGSLWMMHVNPISCKYTAVSANLESDGYVFSGCWEEKSTHAVASLSVSGAGCSLHFMVGFTGRYAHSAPRSPL